MIAETFAVADAFAIRFPVPRRAPAAVRVPPRRLRGSRFASPRADYPSWPQTRLRSPRLCPVPPNGGSISACPALRPRTKPP